MGLGISQSWSTPMWQTPNNFSTPFAFNYGDIWSNFSTSSDNTSNKEMTFEEHLKRREEEQNAAAQKANEQQSIIDLNKLKQDKIKELDISKKLEATKQTKAQVEKAKKSDGSSSVRTPYKKLGFWGKVGRWCSNAGSAVVNIGKNLVGIEKDGKWNWKKCLKNVAITAAAIGACFIPVVGPAIGYGLAATGVAMGAYGTVKGISNLKNASDNDDEAIDNAQQEIFTGAFTAVTSAFGLRGIGKGVSASNASVAAERTSMAGKAFQSVSQFGRDITVNAWRATGEAMKADRLLIGAQSGKWGITRFFQATGAKIKNINNYTNQEQKQSDGLNEFTNNRLKAVDSKIKELKDYKNVNGSLSESDAQLLAHLQKERNILQANQREFNKFFGSNVKKKTEYDKLYQENSGTKAINTIKNDNSLNNFYAKQLLEQQKRYNYALKRLIKTRESRMRYLAKTPDDNKRILKRYVSTNDVEKSLLKPTTWRKNKYQLAIGGKNGSTFNTLITHPASTAPKAIQIFDPVYTIPIGYGQEIASDQYDETIRNLDLRTTQLKQDEKAINDCKDVNELNAIDAQLNQSAQTEITGSENEQKIQG